MDEKILYNELTWEEVNEAVEARKMILLPVAAIEQHGPHLPIDTDNQACWEVCVRAARRAPELLVVAPMIHYGFNEHNMDFPGTVTVKPNHLIGYVQDVARSFVHQGFSRIAIVNGHGSNSPYMDIAARLITARTKALCALVNYYDLGREEVARVRESDVIDHADEFETSEILALRPDLVKREKMKREVPDLLETKWVRYNMLDASPVRFVDVLSRHSRSGIVGDPTKATAEKGDRIMNYAAEQLLLFVREFRDRPDVQRVDLRTNRRP